MSTSKTDFSYLNREGRWPGFRWRGLELRDDGALQLYPLPLLEGDLPQEVQNISKPDGPAGIAIDAEGTIYYSDPAGHRVFRIDGCDGAKSLAGCIGPEGSASYQVDTPRGLLIPSRRRSLFVADSRNHRVQIFDLDSFQLVGVWGQADPSAEPQPGDAPGRFNLPQALAGDRSGNVYVIDYGNRRVQKFNRAGETVAGFWDNLRGAGVLSKPSDIAVFSEGDETLLYIVDEELRSVAVVQPDGQPARNRWGGPIRFGSAHLQEPVGIAVTADAVYVGDNARRRVLEFRREDLEFVGEATGYRGPVAALAPDGRGSLLLHTGAAIEPLRLAIDKGHVTRGVLWSDAIKVREYPVRWRRLQAVVGEIAEGANLRLFVHTSDDETDAPVVDADAEDPFADPRWRPKSEGADLFSDVDDLFIGGEPAGFLWVGAFLSGDGRATPVVSQMRVDFDQHSYLKHLPALYRDREKCGDFLVRFLSLIESFFVGVEEEIADLSVLFDPAVAPREALPWLAGWLGLELDEGQDEQKQRQAIASAFEAYGKRGTAEGLRESLLTFTGVTAIIEEPALNAALWALPAEPGSCGCKKEACLASREKTWDATENSVLGVTTMLAAAEPQGAVAGATAILDQSHLITDEEYGMPLFEDVAHQFSVQVYRGQLGCPETLARVREHIEREKPAHTDYHLCVIEPRMRIGFQARVGIDTVVAGPPQAAPLGESMAPGRGATLGGKEPGRIGEESRVGLSTRVG